MNKIKRPIARVARVTCSVAALLLITGTAHAVKFRLPLAVNTSVHYYYDHAASGIDDWKCGNETYDGHRGTDFSGGPRGTAIYAAAVGTLGYKIDGFGDGYKGSTDGGGFGNYVRLSSAFLTTFERHGGRSLFRFLRRPDKLVGEPKWRKSRHDL
jgi:hypothetical protein